MSNPESHPNTDTDTNEFFDIGDADKGVRTRKSDKEDTETSVDSLPILQTDRYVIDSPLGGGGFGKTYLARRSGGHPDDGDPELVIKVINPDLFESESIRKRFETEVLSHVASEAVSPYVVSIIDRIDVVDSRTGQETVGLVTTRMRGGDLGHLQRELEKSEGIINDAFIGRVGLEIAKALRGIHHAGYIHRDITPGNVLVSRNPFFVKLADFGIAKSIEDVWMAQAPKEVQDDAGYTTPAHTNPGRVSGTPQYMTPEALKGEQVGAERDLYSLGMILYKLRTGKLPFANEYTNGITEGARAQVRKAPPSIQETIGESYIESAYDKLIETLIRHDSLARRGYLEEDGTEEIDYDLMTAGDIVHTIEDIAKRNNISLEVELPKQDNA
jgi:serine/threonine protein kinase